MNVCIETDNTITKKTLTPSFSRNKNEKRESQDDKIFKYCTDILNTCELLLRDYDLKAKNLSVFDKVIYHKELVEIRNSIIVTPLLTHLQQESSVNWSYTKYHDVLKLLNDALTYNNRITTFYNMGKIYTMSAPLITAGEGRLGDILKKTIIALEIYENPVTVNFDACFEDSDSFDIFN